MLIKVCGIKTVDELKVICRFPISHFGFIVGALYKSSDVISIEEAVGLLKCFKFFGLRHPIPVVVTHLVELEDISYILSKLKVSWVQLQNDVSLEVVELLKIKFPYLKVIKAIHANDLESVVFHMVRAFEKVCDYILLDTRFEGKIGGTGRTHDWNVSCRIARFSRRPVILAGGLSHENVYDAVKIVKPFGVDANTRLKGSDGLKDPWKVYSFVVESWKALSYYRQKV